MKKIYFYVVMNEYSNNTVLFFHAVFTLIGCLKLHGWTKITLNFYELKDKVYIIDKWSKLMAVFCEYK